MKKDTDFEKSELAHSCKILHVWLGVLCTAMGILWFLDTAALYDGHGSYSLFESFDKGFIAVSAVILNGCAALSTIIVATREDGSYEPSFWYNLMFSAAYLFNLLGMWSLLGRVIMADNLENLYAFTYYFAGDFPYAHDMTTLGVIFVLIMITYIILAFPYSHKCRYYKKHYF